LKKVAKHTITMPKEFIEGNNYVSEKFIQYARPLAGVLPQMGRLKNVSITKI